jgi:hypothetical protein
VSGVGGSSRVSVPFSHSPERGADGQNCGAARVLAARAGHEATFREESLQGQRASKRPRGARGKFESKPTAAVVSAIAHAGATIAISPTAISAAAMLTFIINGAAAGSRDFKPKLAR